MPRGEVKAFTREVATANVENDKNKEKGGGATLMMEKGKARAQHAKPL